MMTIFFFSPILISVVFILLAGLQLGQPANKSDVLSSLPHRVVSTALNNIHPSPSPASTLSTVMKRTHFHPNPSALLPKSAVATISANPPCGSSLNDTGIVGNTLNACFGSSLSVTRSSVALHPR